MSEERKRSLVGVMAPAKSLPSADDRKTDASSASISSTSSSRKVIIKSADMKEEMQSEAVNIAISAFENLSVEKDIAEQIKKEFDKNHGPTWHCIVGKNFAQAQISTELSEVRGAQANLVWKMDSLESKLDQIAASQSEKFNSLEEKINSVIRAQTERFDNQARMLREILNGIRHPTNTA